MLRRKVPLNYRNVTGVASAHGTSDPQEFESTLEHDFIRLLRFDEINVESYRTQQPVIHYSCPTGRERRYTPDVFVVYRNGLKVMYEVKHRRQLWKDWPKLKPKFKQAIRFGKQNDYKFKIVTEVEIRTDFLKNVQFLERYKVKGETDPRSKLLIARLQNLGMSTPGELVDLSGKSETTRAEILYLLWQLIANTTIKADLSIPLTMQSRIALVDEVLHD